MEGAVNLGDLLEIVEVAVPEVEAPVEVPAEAEPEPVEAA